MQYTLTCVFRAAVRVPSTNVGHSTGRWPAPTQASTRRFNSDLYRRFITRCRPVLCRRDRNAECRRGRHGCHTAATWRLDYKQTAETKSTAASSTGTSTKQWSTIGKKVASGCIVCAGAGAGASPSTGTTRSGWTPTSDGRYGNWKARQLHDCETVRMSTWGRLRRLLPVRQSDRRRSNLPRLLSARTGNCQLLHPASVVIVCARACLHLRNRWWMTPSSTSRLSSRTCQSDRFQQLSVLYTVITEADIVQRDETLLLLYRRTISMPWFLPVVCVRACVYVTWSSTTCQLIISFYFCVNW